MKNESVAIVSDFVLWLFTIGFCKLGFWQGVFAFIVWPYYPGSALGHGG
jgi:hypothetical protein